MKTSIKKNLWKNGIILQVPQLVIWSPDSFNHQYQQMEEAINLRLGLVENPHLGGGFLHMFYVHP